MASKTPGKKISGRVYSFGSSVTPIFLILNHLLYFLSTKYDKIKKKFTVRSHLFLKFSFLVLSNSGSGCH